MRVVCLLGSPRPRGNSAALLEAFADQALALGAEVSRHVLNDLSFRGCQACWACKSGAPGCVLDDDLAPVLEEVRDCDVLALASPVYYGDLSSQLKTFVDRTFGYLVPDYPLAATKTRLTPGRTACLLLAQGHPLPERFADIIPRYAYFLRMLGFDRQFPVRAVGVYHQGDVQVRPSWLEEAARSARLALGVQDPTP